MYRMACKDPQIESACRRLSCVYPGICENLGTDHAPLIQLYRKARSLPGIKKVLIGSGLRYDLAVRSPEYVRELVTHHVGGYLKIAPEHITEGPLSKMMKPGIGAYDRFKAMFDQYSREAGKEQYLIPYFIAAHPGTTDADMVELALWLKRNGFRLDQVQTFLPTPLALATAMYHTGKNPLRKVGAASENVDVVRAGRQRRLHKAFLRYHDPENWPLLREALQRLGRADLIGNGKRHLVPQWQPAGTALAAPRQVRPSAHRANPAAARASRGRNCAAARANGALSVTEIGRRLGDLGGHQLPTQLTTRMSGTMDVDVVAAGQIGRLLRLAEERPGGHNERRIGTLDEGHHHRAILASRTVMDVRHGGGNPGNGDAATHRAVTGNGDFSGP
jgi:hypothetical protein